jgi:hypothetical protein
MKYQINQTKLFFVAYLNFEYGEIYLYIRGFVTADSGTMAMLLERRNRPVRFQLVTIDAET